MSSLSDRQPSNPDKAKASLWARLRLWWRPESASDHAKPIPSSSSAAAMEISKTELDKARSNQECVQSQISR
jgi:hypothetical protein